MINKKIKVKTFILLLIIAFFLQITFVSQYFHVFTPNFILIILLAGSIVDRSSKIINISFIIGFILELFSDMYFGIIMVSIILMVFVVSVLSTLFIKRIFSYNLFFISTIGILTYNTIHIILININEINNILYIFNQLISIIIFQIIFTLIFIFPLTHFIIQKNEE
ncbi:MAG: rod shape-determining protein MreD [Candidatus Pacebacteria bacterium]|nr:rod shape-determining protein MreD [Candidatus Paceibacterota bacterium]